MSKVAVALCAFIAGAFCALFLKGDARIVAASSANFQTNAAKSTRSVFKGGGAFKSGTGVLIQGASPSFLPLEATPIFEEFTFSDISNQPLDGLDCRNCTFNNTVLTYSGGAYNLENVQFLGTTRLILSGAAANTLALAQLLRGLGKGVKTASLTPNKPVQRKATVTKPLPKMNFTAPYIGLK